MESVTLAVKLQDSFEGLAESNGILSTQNNSIKLQFQTKDAILGLIKSEVKSLEIPLKNVVEIALKKNLFGNKLIIKVDDLSISAQLPYSENNEIMLTVARKELDDAIDFVRAIQLDMSEKEYNQAIQQTQQTQQMEQG